MNAAMSCDPRPKPKRPLRAGQIRLANGSAAGIGVCMGRFRLPSTRTMAQSESFLAGQRQQFVGPAPASNCGLRHGPTVPSPAPPPGEPPGDTRARPEFSPFNNLIAPLKNALATRPSWASSNGIEAATGPNCCRC